MNTDFQEGMTVVTSDDHKIGTVVGSRDDCLLVKTGHVFHATHAIPAEFVNEVDGQLRATVSKEIVDESPKVEDDNFDCHAVRLHYGLEGNFVVDPDPEGMETADTERTEQERLNVLEGREPAEYRQPTVRERQGNANDPTGVTANLRDKG